MNVNSIYERVRDLEHPPFDPFDVHENIESFAKNPRDHAGKANWDFQLDLTTTESKGLQLALAKVSPVPFASHKTDLGGGGAGGNGVVSSSVWNSETWEPLWQGLLSKGVMEEARACIQQQKAPIKALLKIATPAPFGKGEETVLDTSVRKAFEIPASKIPDDLLDGLSRDFDFQFHGMCPHGKKWILKPYKMHLYGPGGKFEKHVDTLHAHNHVATVVVGLPSSDEYQGGNLLVEFRGETVDFDFSLYPNNVQAACFFTDCTHEVKEVTSGWRVVLQYDVFESEDSDLNSSSGRSDVYSDEESYDDPWDSDGSNGWMNEIGGNSKPPQKYLRIGSAENVERLRSAVSVYLAPKQSEAVAIFLCHRYSLLALDSSVLKGTDRLIYNALASTGDKHHKLNLSLCGVIVTVESNYDGWNDSDSIAIHEMTMDQILFGKVDDDEDGKKKMHPPTKVFVVCDKSNTTGFRAILHRDYIEYMGNEAQKRYDAYFHACMVIQPFTSTSENNQDVKPPAVGKTD